MTGNTDSDNLFNTSRATHSDMGHAMGQERMSRTPSPPELAPDVALHCTEIELQTYSTFESYRNPLPLPISTMAKPIG